MKPLVSISCITYNHKNYIEECLNGFLMQQTNFSFEILIYDDASTDGTTEIIKEYEIKYPDLIRPIYQLENQYSKGQRGINVKYNFSRAKGKYIALCEGDDYWTDPYKLQKQVDFLESHPAYIIHSGKAQVLKNHNLIKKTYNTLEPKTYDIKGFYTLNRIYTCTVMFRKISRAKFEFENKLFGDWIYYISLLSTKPGNLAYVSKEVYAVYRVHNGGAMQTVSQLYKNAEAQITHIYAINNFIKCEYSEKDIQRINDYCLVIFSHYLNISEYKKCINILYKNLGLVKHHISVKGYLSLLYRKILPKT
ncbi:glycosyltransferase family 2 protein [Salegentibacter sp. HM20]